MQNLAPGRVGGGAAPVALVHDDEIEEVGRELLEDVLRFLGARDRLVQGQVDFERLVDLAVLDPGHSPTEGLEVFVPGLGEKDVAVGEKEDAFLHPCLPQAPNDLERGVGLAGAGGHDQQDAILLMRDGLDHLVDGVQLVVARRLARGIGVVVLGYDGSGRVGQAFPRAVTAPEIVRAGELVELQLRLDLAGLAGAVAEQKAGTIR